MHSSYIVIHCTAKESILIFVGNKQKKVFRLSLFTCQQRLHKPDALPRAGWAILRATSRGAAHAQGFHQEDWSWDGSLALSLIHFPRAARYFCGLNIFPPHAAEVQYNVITVEERRRIGIFMFLKANCWLQVEEGLTWLSWSTPFSVLLVQEEIAAPLLTARFESYPLNHYHWQKNSPASKQTEKYRSPPVARLALNRDTVTVPLVYLPWTKL